MGKRLALTRAAVAGAVENKSAAKIKRIVFASWDPDGSQAAQTPNHAFTMIRAAVLNSGKKPGSASDWAHASRLIDACASCEAPRKVADDRPGYAGRDRIVTDLKVGGATMELGTGEFELLREMWKTLKPTLELGAAKSVRLMDRTIADLVKGDALVIDDEYPGDAA